MEYDEFIKNKRILARPAGFDVQVDQINAKLFDWQRALVRVALLRGRSALFEDCGLGKTFQQLEWARIVCEKTKQPVIILAPLAVGAQTKKEGLKINVNVTIAKSQDDILPGINITNYERLHKFDMSMFSGVVLDESSIIKHFSGKIRNQIIDLFLETPYKLCCTATPSPNDFTELGNTAEFLGVMTRAEMLSMFFINDTGDTTANWRLKGHVKDKLFWDFVASWSVMLQRPSDIGFDNAGFDLPQLNIKEVVIPFAGIKKTLFVEPAHTLSERRAARKESLDERVRKTADMVNKSDEIWIVWCNLNQESTELARQINGAVEVTGSDNTDHKERSMVDFAEGKIKCLVSKPSIAGMGMNFQACHKMAFVGLSDSFEQYYQAVRRCWRFGQTKPVDAYIVFGEREGAVVENVKRKEMDMQLMFSSMIDRVKDITKTEIHTTTRRDTIYIPVNKMIKPKFMEETCA